MRRDTHAPELLRAVLVGLLLLAGSIGLLLLADAPLDVMAVAGSVGVVTALALLSLTTLVAAWRRGASTHVATTMHDDAVAAAFDDPAVELPLDDAAAI